ncbi:hypothetical protein SteCoe_34044 [Stentor coeruleus]|uniref:Uncharacterized protein n=1 Tax=Stentor coeruleus TaxID=5963 RepID=A0A1R2AVD8_9CILI|nr:hypothetical protein SteCoe_34044 [Stentor coeruleus]
MGEIVTNKEKLILKKFISAEDVRKSRFLLKKQLEKQKIVTPQKLQIGTKRINDLESQLVQEMSLREKRNQDRSSKLYNSIVLHHKVVKQLLEQESKIIRKPKRSFKKIDRLPYLRKIQAKLLESVQMSDSDSESESDEIEIMMPRIIIPKGYQILKLKSSFSPSPIKSKVYSHLSLNK